MADIPDLTKTEIAIVELTNAFRRSEKLADVRPNAQLTLAARLFAEYLAKTGQFAHEADGRQPADRAKAAGYAYCVVAENLALNLDSRGFTTAALAGQAVEGWKNSPGHRRNMLLEHVVETGVAVARAPDRDPKFLSVQLFGRPATLTYDVRIENRSSGTVSYTFAGATHAIEPRVVATHTACTPAEITFDRAGNWLTGQKLDARYSARDGSLFAITSGPDGRTLVEHTPGSLR